MGTRPFFLVQFRLTLTQDDQLNRSCVALPALRCAGWEHVASLSHRLPGACTHRRTQERVSYQRPSHPRQQRMQRLVGNKVLEEVLEGGGNEMQEGGTAQDDQCPGPTRQHPANIVVTPRASRPTLTINKPEMSNKSEGPNASPGKASTTEATTVRTTPTKAIREANAPTNP